MRADTIQQYSTNPVRRLAREGQARLAAGEENHTVALMSVMEIERAFEKLSAAEQEQFAEWFEGRLARGGFAPANEEAWAVEVENRLEDVRSGKVQPIPGEQVMAELRRRYSA